MCDLHVCEHVHHTSTTQQGAAIGSWLLSVHLVASPDSSPYCVKWSMETMERFHVSTRGLFPMHFVGKREVHRQIFARVNVPAACSSLRVNNTPLSGSISFSFLLALQFDGVAHWFSLSHSLESGHRDCYPGEWPCPASGRCIPIDKVCDGTPDCPAGEDETNITAGRLCSE